MVADPVVSQNDVLLWVDVETTGLNARTDRLLQVAAVVTDVRGGRLSDDFEHVVRHTPAQARAAHGLAGDYVRNMHAKTGLWDRLTGGTPLAQVDAALLEFLSAHAPQPRQARLAGNSVRLDLNFAEVNLPVSYAHLHYRSVDVSALAYAAVSWGLTGGYYEKAGTHEALSDIHESIVEYRWVMSTLAARGQGTT